MCPSYGFMCRLTARYCLRIFNKLLTPVSEKTSKILKSVVATDRKGIENKDEFHSRVDQEIALKSNALEQISALLAFKEAMVADDSSLFNAICNTLAGPLRKSEKDRKDGENQIIETVLHLLR